MPTTKKKMEKGQQIQNEDK